MKHFFFLLIVFGLNLQAFTQIVPSDCTAPDSVSNLYLEDAQRLTLDRIYDHNYVYTDSVIIPASYSDTVLNALLALYNVTGILERDTVIDMLDIHTRKEISMNELYISADSNLIWMQNLNNGIINSTEPTLDSIVAEYGLNLDGNNSFPFNPFFTAFFSSSENFNLRAITNTLETISGVYWAEPNIFGGDGHTIYDTIYPTHVELTFRYAWGDCPAGCTGQRRWKFNVYYDCSVEFVGSSGQTLPATAGVQDLQLADVTIHPNPFQNKISVNGFDQAFNYRIVDLTGEVVEKGVSQNGQIKTSELSSGSYLLLIQSENRTARQKILKN